MKLFANFRPESDFKVLDQYQDKPISFFYDYLPKDISELSINPINILMIHEPNEFFGMHDWVIRNSHLFSVILTWSQKILTQCPNSYPFTCNYHQDSKEYYKIFESKEKKFEISFLSGIKTLSEGHKLRQEVYKIGDQITIPKKWFDVLDDFDKENNVRPGYSNYSKPIPNLPEHLKKNPQVFGKRICYEESMFHICIENVKHDNWYTEKISEAFCTKTIPIYWGCSNISEFGYDERGIIRFDSPEELPYIINNLTPEKYLEMKPYIDYNYKVALEDSFSNKLNEFFTQLVEINNL